MELKSMNMDNMQSKLKQSKSEGKNPFWKPQRDKDYTFRIFPDVDGDPFKARYMHYGIAGPAFVCPKEQYGEPCPACEMVAELWKVANELKTDSSKKMAKDAMAKRRYFSQILVRGEKSIKIYGYGKTVYEWFIKKVLRPDYGDISHPETGVDIIFRTNSPESGGFPTTDLDTLRTSTPLISADLKKENITIDTLYEEAPKINEEVLELTKEEIEERVKKHLENPKEEESEEYAEEDQKEDDDNDLTKQLKATKEKAKKK